ncbi:electron transport complex subunit RsxA [Cellulosilyticum sp. ST5]|uniref:Ion-translocating oxidoreductase complex subunit A n=1 Tax=Cellulosilyticum lentocellum (strain ATCC 49066 / DSM 5427 / NCIMB 11756 / RHM5) TaxID=642492 RepID=F2JQE1_CELLD|nr:MULTISPECIES: electron transport complex subunit RsxA [Cellulosilyticum]ADZ83803.1 electron transport complex, RnfABCDGE type, A subunit [Cellulosilyticum lentocellum DSM 5427]QEH69191.1 electron transport complex subunit RsxA [Cellulosilyticum sp. WCF-2]
MELLLLFIGAALVNNFVLVKFLGICAFLGVSKKVETSLGMGAAVTFVMGLASMFSYLVYRYILVPLELEYLYTLAFILVIASLVQFVEMVIQKVSPSLHSALGVYLPLITTNCAVLGVAVLNMQQNYSLIQSVVNGLGAAIGFTITMLLMSGIRERIEDNDVLSGFKGLPLALMIAGFMAIAFSGFQNMIK